MIDRRTFHTLAYATERIETPNVIPTASQEFQATQTVVISLPDRRLLVVPLDDETMQEFVPWAEEAAIMICECTECNTDTEDSKTDTEQVTTTHATTETTGAQPQTQTTIEGHMQTEGGDIHVEDTLEAGQQQQIKIVTETRASE